MMGDSVKGGLAGRCSFVSGHSPYRRRSKRVAPCTIKEDTRVEIRWRRAAAQLRVPRERLLKYLAPCPRRHRTRGQRINCYRRRLSPRNAVRVGHHNRKSARAERTRRCGKQQVEVVIQVVNRYL